MRSIIFIGVFLLSGCVDKGDSRKDVTEAQTPWFQEQAVERGLIFEYQSGESGQHLFPEIMGGGAIADLDNDGDLDIYLVQGGNLTTDNSPGNQLFLNDGGRFERVPGAGGAADTGYGMGVTTGDYDNDGDVDLYVTNFGANVLLRNNGAGEFEDVSKMAGVADSGWGTAALFHDLDLDGDLDLFVVNYVNWQPDIERECFNQKTSLSDYCSPNHYGAPAADRLYRNNGDGTFTDVSDQAGLAAAFGNGLGVAAADVNADGLFVSLLPTMP